MSRWVGVALALALACALGPTRSVGAAQPAAASQQPAAADERLARRLDAALAARALDGARVAALVVSRDDGRELYARQAGRALVPASNQKILTAVAALSAFGPAHRFTTDVFSDAPPDAEGGVDTLYLRGGGDPGLTTEDLGGLAADLRRTGLRRVRGGLVLDDSAFDAVRWHPSWGKTGARAYHAPVGALMANYGAFAVSVAPGAQVGEPLRVVLEPPVDHLRLVSRASTSAARARNTLVVDRRAVGTALEVRVSGTLPLGSAERIHYRSVLDPAYYAASVLRYQLAARGITVAGETRRGTAPPDASPLLAFDGKTLAEIVRLFMKYSNNAVAEALVKNLGRLRGGSAGSWSAGMPALRAELQGLGIDTSDLELVDGSGLSYENRVTPRALVQALRVADGSFRFGPELGAALPIAAADGTLAERAEAAALSVRAKTGLLTRVTALSGYAERHDGGQVIFSILANGYRGGDERAMAALDGFVAALVAPP